MAYDIIDVDDRDVLDRGTTRGFEAANEADCADADGLFAAGIRCAAGETPDLTAAHMWFNLAAMRGHGEAAQHRREIAAEMTDAEIGAAQRRARDWLRTHPLAEPRPAPVVLRIAA